ncbi:hypothetical protein GCM10010172_38000 [Paractinoplanes ferrugineus]|uniref:Uncharacterized protein n=1 Tax=Paractinoplanes ferrugineus TaxID=113564 RepID=A0A919IX22_9ACTN|nr:hypothetical protein [Actinoplanes ferrugineus]GIE09397.1 hypothetical protein Afe05nite_12370 [Actinoplanes ferrugineus]
MRAAEIRQEWLEIGLSTTPVDRPATEEAIASIYAACRRDRPEFRWVPSPAAALPHLTGLPTHRTLLASIDSSRPPVAADIAAGLSRLRSAVLATYVEPAPDRSPMKRPKGKPWPVLPLDQALAEGLPFHELVHQGVGEALRRTLADNLHNPLRSLLATLLPTGSRTSALSARDHLPVGWYGSQDAAWIAHLDVLRRLRLVSIGPATGAGDPPAMVLVAGDSPLAAFAAWVTLARSGGWWWPGERQCVVAERPTVIRTEPIPGAWHGERRLHHAPVAVEYRDGWFR